MNLLKHPFRRTTAILAGAFVGLAGVVAFAAPASAHLADLTGKTSCLEDGNWKVDWTLNTTRTKKDGVISDVKEEPATGTALTKLAKGQSVPQNTAVTDTQSFDKSVSKVTLWLEVTWNDGRDRDAKSYNGGAKDTFKVKVQKSVDAPGNCPVPTPTPTPTVSPSPTPTIPPIPDDLEPIFNVTCDTLTFGLKNPADSKTVTLTYKTSKGETRTLVIKPGSEGSEKFSATPGFTVDVIFSAEGEKDETITIPYKKPADCDDGEGGGLPVTGAAAGSIAGGAVLLLAIGGVLFFMARRRKVKFTA